MIVIENLTYGEERALYNSENLHIISCRFDGEEDGESAIKESENILAEDCYFNLRYPLWHCNEVTVACSEMSEKCRAPLWYSKNIRLEKNKINGTKALRECENIEILNSVIVSDEFGWSSKQIKAEKTQLAGEYFMLRARDISLKSCSVSGKYSFQYIDNTVIEDCIINTKDAFWHAKNVVVKNSVIRGEYLGWYSENLTFENCKIIGTQPFCYCKGLKLIDCEMADADLSFEKSQVWARIKTPIVSIKNPTEGRIEAPSCEKIILTDPNAKCEIVIG